MDVAAYSFPAGTIRSPLRFAFVSDLHNYPGLPVREAICAIDPDAVLVGGDFIQSATDRETGLRFLRSLSARWPVICSSGKEHDFDGALIEEIEAAGAVFLRNRSLEFGGILIGGLNTIPITGKTEKEKQALIGLDRAWLAEFGSRSGYKLLLCHHPEYYDLFVREYPVDLILSGHAHGGQIRLLGRGVWAPGQGWFPRYTAGLYDGRLLVSRGIGNSHRIPRIHNPPEVLKITLTPAPG